MKFHQQLRKNKGKRSLSITLERHEGRMVFNGAKGASTNSFAKRKKLCCGRRGNSGGTPFKLENGCKKSDLPLSTIHKENKQ